MLFPVPRDDHRQFLSPIVIPVDETAPPSKDAILPCRQLYCEAKKMQNAAYRAYWTGNQFNFEGKPVSRPSDENLQHIRHFSSSVEGHHLFDLVFELGRWQARVSPFIGKPLDPKVYALFYSWRRVQREVDYMVGYLLQGDHVSDPRVGQGWSSFGLTTLLGCINLTWWEWAYKGCGITR
jgi:hypothetical protein